MYGLYEDLPPIGTKPSTPSVTPNTSTNESSSTTSPPQTSGNSNTNTTPPANETTSGQANEQKTKPQIISEWSVGAKLLAPALRAKAAQANATPNNNSTQLKPRNLVVKPNPPPKNPPKPKPKKHSHEHDDNSPFTSKAQQALVSTSLVQTMAGNTSEIYDPMYPNDYDDWVKEKTYGKSKDRDRDRERNETEAQSDEEASPQASKKAKTSQESDQSGINPAVAKMMAKMGYKSGMGLGKDQQGITAPLLAKKTNHSAAVIINANNPTEQSSSKIGSTVLLLTNMVGPGEVDQELQGEIEEECSKYGKVIKCKIYEDKQPITPEDQSVRIFIQFSDFEGCKKASEALQGRFFGGREVTAIFYSPERFHNNELAYVPEDN